MMLSVGLSVRLSPLLGSRSHQGCPICLLPVKFMVAAGAYRGVRKRAICMIFGTL